MALRLWWLVGMICVISGHNRLHRSRRGYLRCRTGVTLEVYPDGAINGTRGKGGKYAFLQIVFTNEAKKSLAFFGIHSKFYLCMSTGGKLYGNVKMDNECIFNVKMLPYYYTSYYRKIGKRKNMFIGLSRSGKPRSFRRKNKRTQFMWFKSRSKRAFRKRW